MDNNILVMSVRRYSATFRSLQIHVARVLVDLFSFFLISICIKDSQKQFLYYFLSYMFCYIVRQYGRDFKLGGALTIIGPNGARRENCWGISYEKSQFYAEKNIFSFNFRGAPGVPLPPPWIHPWTIGTIKRRFKRKG